MTEKEPQFLITLSNQASDSQLQSSVEAYCFAEAASKAYLLRNNRNQSLEPNCGWWKIHSVSEVNSHMNVQEGK